MQHFSVWKCWLDSVLLGWLVLQLHGNLLGKLLCCRKPCGPTWPVPLATHHSVMPWHCWLLPVTRGYPQAGQQLNELPIRCPSAVGQFICFQLPRSLSFDAPSLPRWLPSHPCGSKQLCRQGPGMWSEASAQKCFKIFHIYMSETFLGRVRGGVPTRFPLWDEHSSSQHWCRQVTGHFTFLWFRACLLVLGWQMHSVCVWVHGREDQQLVDLNHTRRGSLPLCNVSIAWGEIAEYKLRLLQRRHHYWFVLRCFGRLWVRLDSWRYLWERSPSEI